MGQWDADTAEADMRRRMAAQRAQDDVATWPAVPAMAPRMFAQPPQAQPPQQLGVQDVFPGMPNSPFQEITAEEAMRQMRIERARQSYERNFGMHHRGGASMASQGGQQNIDLLLERIKRARADGSYPRRS